MKLFGPLFWGVFLILAGVVFLLRYLLPYQFSAWSVVAGLFVVLIGASLLWGSFHPRQPVVFEDVGIVKQEGSKYDLAFSSTTIDLTDKKPEDGPIDIDVAFSSVDIKLPAGAVRLSCDVAFSGVTLPDGQTMSFGERDYTLGEGATPLVVKVDGAFCRIGITRAEPGE